ncbi:MAG TPA: SH3 domain-containing protein [Spirochaetota bacterium]|nr:SH3 domain-containing protein [Spirochaetota bacterium]HQE59722.1 SH3 domain-containing protein [Spirochaetota bacterium]
MKKIIFLSLFFLFGAKPEIIYYGIIKGDNVRIRSDKSLSSKVIGVLKKFDTITIIGDSKKEFEIDGQSYLWYNISYKGKTGWVYGKFVNILPTEPKETEYYLQSFANNFTPAFTIDNDNYHSRNDYKNSIPSRKDFFVSLREPGYLHVKTEIYEEFCVDTFKHVYQYNGDKFKLIMTGADAFKIHKNYIFYIRTFSEFNNEIISSIKVYDMNKPVKKDITSSYDCIFEKVFEMEENSNNDISLGFDYETLTLHVYMHKLEQTISVLKFKNGVFQP